MLNHPGSQLKNLAKAMFWLIIIIFIVLGFVVMNGSSEYRIIGIVFVFLGIIVAWCSTILLYAFGELVDSTEEIKKAVTWMAKNMKNR